MKKLLDHFTKPFAKAPPTSDAVKAQLDAARQVLADAEATYRSVALAAVDDPTVDIDQTEQGVTEARRKISRLEAALTAALSREATDRQAAIAKAEDAQDEELRSACDLVIKMAPRVAALASEFVSALIEFTKACGTVQQLARGNPRSRQDIATYMVKPSELLATELARIAPEGMAVPGMDKMIRHTTPPDRIMPLAAHVEELFNALKPEVRHD